MSTLHLFQRRVRERLLVCCFRRGSVLLLLLLLAFCNPGEVLNAAVVYEQDFATVDDGWNVGATAPGTIEFAPGAVSGTAFPTRSLELSHVAGNTTRLTSSMPAGQFSISKASTERYTFQFDLRISRANAAGYIVFLDRNSGSQLPMLVQITSTGNFVSGYWNGTSNTNNFVLLSGYEVDTTYTFTFTTTPSSGLFSLSVTGGDASLENQPYRRTLAGLSPFAAFNGMQVYNDGGSASGASYDIYVDNIVITSVPEPGTAVALAAGMVVLTLGVRRRSWRKG